MPNSRPVQALACTLGFAALLAGCDGPSMPPDPVAAETAAAAQAVAENRRRADGLLTGRMRDVLLRDPQLKAFEIRVVTTNGEAHLSGVLDSRGQIDTALRLARSLPGVRIVHDDMTLNR